ncbi:enoyl-CoA hydratase [Pseudomonas aeruginosa]|uniref:enoyl-CoA hydratase/isomerase family protein n=1 Tax=Pseudomonas aeruginosa TaxID=287 RepID=UPI000F53066E|nr:enoyl-CoA hydratase-related protein [Pseudomonas aeruginosa]MCO2075306.1 enoyl-CoA hydratase [Pseudomonas aeruginosa]RQF50384.1 enoyl-CoA hydratase [Pseudomonas aeruginosa]
MKGAPVRLEVEASIAEVVFDRPESLNAIDVASARCLLSLCEELRGRTDVRVIVLSGAGRAFMAGGDLAAFHAATDPVRLASEIIEPLHQALALLATLPQPVLGSVQGAVSGAGMSIALGCDLTIAAADCRFCLAYSGIAASLDAGGSWHLARQVGLQRAMRLALLNEVLSAEQAQQLGLVAQVVEPGDLVEATHKLAQRLAAGPGFAYGQIKGLLRGASSRTLEQQLDAEHEAFRACAGSGDFCEGVAAFFAKRRALFRGN